MSAARLLPCPFCGNQKPDISYVMHPFSNVVCHACGAKGPTGYGAEAVTLWNASRANADHAYTVADQEWFKSNRRQIGIMEDMLREQARLRYEAVSRLEELRDAVSKAFDEVSMADVPDQYPSANEYYAYWEGDFK